MWVTNGDAVVRAPTPQNFDRLVQKLEDDDSVLFQSVSLPSASAFPDGQSPSALPSRPQTARAGQKPAAVGEGTPPSDDLPNLRARLRELELAGAQKDQTLREKDEQIAALEERLAGLTDSEAVPVYKARYEGVLTEFEQLKKSLADAGKLRKVPRKSAREMKPFFV
jgi:hypothetical protein